MDFVKTNKSREMEDSDEISDEINAALRDPKGLLSHKKRLAFCLSLGVSDILENYLKNKNVLKHGNKIDHRWLKKKKENVKKLLAEKTTSLDSLDKLDRILDVSYEIESKRNELAYGEKASEESLKGLINQFLDLKKEVENEKRS